MRAIRESQEGATTPKGKFLFDENGRPLMTTTGKTAFQLAGLRPERQAELTKDYMQSRNIEAFYTKKRQDIFTRFRLAKTREERQEALKDLQDYNIQASQFKGAIPLINASSLLRLLLLFHKRRIFCTIDCGQGRSKTSGYMR